MLTILTIACTHTGADYADVMRPCNRGNQPGCNSEARRLCAAAMLQYGWSKHAIARALSIARTSVLHALEVHESMMTYDKAYRARYAAFIAAIPKSERFISTGR